MKPRNLLIAAVLLAALSGIVWWSKKHPPTADTSPASTSPKLVTVPDKEVKSLTVKKKDAPAIDLQLESGKWHIAAPAQYNADNDAVTGMLSSLNPLTADSMVDDKPGDGAKYGFNTPSLVVTATRNNGKSDQITFGDDVPAGSLVYARANSDPKVYAVASSAKTSLDKSLNDLRDKRLLTFDSTKVARVELKSERSDVEFGKNNANDWQIMKPAPFRADTFQVEDLLRKLAEAKMDVSGSAADQAKTADSYSHGTAAASVNVSDASGTQTLTVRKNKDDYFAQSSVVNGMFKIGSDLGKAVEKPLDEYRTKKIFDFGFSDPTKLSVTNGPDEKVLMRSGTDWKMAGKTMDAGAVQALIDKMRDLSATKFTTTGFGNTALSLGITSNEGKRTEKVEFAKNSEGYLARRERESALYQLDTKAVDDVISASNGLKPAATATKK